jgi:membrane protein required for colicin V production
METYDLFMLLVLVAATLFGLWKGLAWQLASVASLVISYAAALRLSPRLAPRFGDTAPWNKFVAMLVIFVVTSFAIWTAYRLVAGLIDRVKLKEFDHQLGALLGLGKGVLWCIGITFFAVTLLPPAQKETIVASRTGRYIVAFLAKADAVVPPEIQQVIHPYVDKVQQRLDPNYQPTYQQQYQDLQNLWPSEAAPASSQDQRSQQPPGTWPPDSYTAEDSGRRVF